MRQTEGTNRLTDLLCLIYFSLSHGFDPNKLFAWLNFLQALYTAFPCGGTVCPFLASRCLPLSWCRLLRFQSYITSMKSAVLVTKFLIFALQTFTFCKRRSTWLRMHSFINFITLWPSWRPDLSLCNHSPENLGHLPLGCSWQMSARWRWPTQSFVFVVMVVKTHIMHLGKGVNMVYVNSM